MYKTLYTLALIPLLMLPAASLFAEAEVNTGTGLTLAGPPLAMRGYDPVAYFNKGGPELGDAKHSVVHAGSTYRFANKANKKAFEKDPQRYAPQFGGFCAFGVSVNAKFDGDPNLWKIVDGKLYFNLNKDIQGNWLKDVDGNIHKAEKNWKTIQGKAPSALK